MPLTCSTNTTLNAPLHLPLKRIVNRKLTVNQSMLNYFLAVRDRMHSYPDFTLFRYLTDGKKVEVL